MSRSHLCVRVLMYAHAVTHSCVRMPRTQSECHEFKELSECHELNLNATNSTTRTATSSARILEWWVSVSRTQWVVWVSRIYARALTHSCVGCLIRTSVTTRSYIYVRLLNARDSTWSADLDIRLCATTHAYVCHDLSMHVPWLIHMCAMIPRVWHVSFLSVACFVHMCGVILSYVGRARDLLICVTWLIHMCDMSHVCHDSFIYVTCLTCAMTHSYMWHVSMCKTRNL